MYFSIKHGFAERFPVKYLLVGPRFIGLLSVEGAPQGGKDGGFAVWVVDVPNRESIRCLRPVHRPARDFFHELFVCELIGINPVLFELREKVTPHGRIPVFRWRRPQIRRHAGIVFSPVRVFPDRLLE
jgi:hypothetical protein